VSNRKKLKTESSEDKIRSRRLLRVFGIVLFTLAFVAALVWGIARLGDGARRSLGPRDRYSVRFAEIECEQPPGLDHSTFLSEVRYCSGFPEIFQSLDPNLSPKLSKAFASHPWVANVETVHVAADGKVGVKLKYRTPLLAVRTVGETRVVDSAGVLLPISTSSAGLPELITPVPSPAVSAGQLWADANVVRACELVETHHPVKLGKTTTGWRLTMADGKTLVLVR
jgi:hypothetical protein